MRQHERQREYEQRPERRAKKYEYQREYRQRPEYKAKRRERYLHKKKLREEEWFLLDEQVNELLSTESGDTPWLRGTYELYNT